MSQRINRVSPGSAGKIFGVMYFVFGLIFMPFLLLPALFAGDSAGGVGLGLALAIPVVYGIVGYIGMAIFAWIYNLIAARIGGLEVEITTIAEP